MTSISSLNKFYLKTFRNLAILGVFPYAATFTCLSHPEPEEKIQPVNVAAAIACCSILTFVIPILPIATAVTLFVAKIGMLLAATSMLFAYPVAFGLDCINQANEDISNDFPPSCNFAM